MNNINKFSLMVGISAFIIGCSPSDSDNASGSNVGYFIDSAVQGAHYKTTSGLEGDTDLTGKFSYNTGDKVTFNLGKITLGESEPGTDGLITPKSLIVGDNTEPTTEQAEQISLLLRTLQSLDNDGNASNGISFSAEVLEALKNLSEDHNMRDINETKLLELDDSEHNLGLDKDYDGHIDVDKDEAKSHFEDSKKRWDDDKDSKGNKDSKDDKDSKGDKDSDDKKDSENKKGSENKGGSGHEEESKSEEKKEFKLDDYSKTENLSLEIKKSLAYMGNEEKLAYDVYIKLGKTYPNSRQFTNIAKRSEIKHTKMVQDLIKRYEIKGTDLSDGNYTDAGNQYKEISDMESGKYGVVAVQNLYNALIEEASDEITALKVACKIEVTDINDLDKYIDQAKEASDINATFDKLREGSYTHYWAFDKALKAKGETNGCFVEGDSLLTDKNDKYPKH